MFLRKSIQPEDTLKFPWLSLFSGQQANIRIQTCFARQGLPEPHLALESHSLQIAFKMITEHEFIACMPVPLANATPELGLREVRLPRFSWSIPTGVTYHRASKGFAPLVQLLRSLRKQTSIFERPSS